MVNFFKNKDCEYYPCHKLHEINCIFCYCPLYTKECGGDYVMKKDIKDCSNCLFPHKKENYNKVIDKL